MGHISAAKAIEKNIKAKDPTAVIELKNIRDFMPKWRNVLDEKLFWFVVKKMPERFNKMFLSKMDKTNKDHNYLEHITNGYSEKDVLSYLQSKKPTHIIATHYGSAETLIKLRQQGQLKDTPIGWLHTDYFEGYFPQISRHIEHTFLGIKALEDRWNDRGVDDSKVTTTGLPINPKAFEPVDRVAFLKSQNLDPAIKTIVLASGGEGVGDFPAIVKSISEKIKEPIQMVVFCSNNKQHVVDLNTLKPSLPKSMDLRVIGGFVDNDVMMNMIKSSDVYITKSGGLSPTEGFAINKPIVLLDVYGGHERKNAELFEGIGLAIINKQQNEIGTDVHALLYDSNLKQSLLAKQKDFREAFNLDAITKFALNTPIMSDYFPENFGLEHGPHVKKSEGTLNQLSKDSPAEVELILSYGKSKDGKKFSENSNPFGHLALRIGEKVFILNKNAKKGKDKELVHSTTLDDYLYGVDAKVKGLIHTDSFGSSYAVDNLSIRINGITPQQQESMLSYFSNVNQDFEKGDVEYSTLKFNSATLIKEALEKAGYNDISNFPVAIPLNVFTEYKDYFEKSTKHTSEVVLYSRARGSENQMKSTGFPISPLKLRDLILSIFDSDYTNKLEEEVGKRVSIGTSSPQAYLDNLNEISKEKDSNQLKKDQDFLDQTTDYFSKLEEKLGSLKEETDKLGYQLNDFEKKLQIISKEYTPEELSQVINNNITSLTFPNSQHRENALALYKGFKTWENLQTDYQASIDNFTRQEMTYLIIATQSTIRVLVNDFKVRLPKNKSASIYESYEKLENQFESFYKLFSKNGSFDEKLLASDFYKNYFRTAKYLISSYQEETSLEVNNHINVKRIFAKSKRFLSFLSSMIKLSPEALKVFFQIFYPSTSDKNSKNSLLASSESFFQKFAKEFKFKIVLKNGYLLERLNQSSQQNEKIINIFTPNQSHPIHDAMLLSSLNLPNYLLVLGADQSSMNKFVSKKMLENENIINLGQESDTSINNVVNELKKGLVKNIVVYPEGSSSKGLRETRTINPKFSNELIKKLMAEGYHVNIVPVSYTNSAKLLNENTISGFFKNIIQTGQGATLNAQINKPIPFEIVDALSKSGRMELLDLYIRQSWLEDLDINSKSISGALKSQALMERFENEFKINVRDLQPHLKLSTTTSKASSCGTFYKMTK